MSNNLYAIPIVRREPRSFAFVTRRKLSRAFCDNDGSLKNHWEMIDEHIPYLEMLIRVTEGENLDDIAFRQDVRDIIEMIQEHGAVEMYTDD